MTQNSLFTAKDHEDEHPFKEPWQAHAFAMAVKLHEQGLFSWNEWAETLGKFIAEAGPDDSPDNYYHHWMAALEAIIEAKKVTGKGELKSRRDQWDRAAKATPHGRPIVLAADPLSNN